MQQSVVEHAAFYATNPAVLGGMVKLTEVLGLASVLLTQKSEAIQKLLDSYMKPLEQLYQNGKEKYEQLEDEMGVYRAQVGMEWVAASSELCLGSRGRFSLETMYVGQCVGDEQVSGWGLSEGGLGMMLQFCDCV